LELILLYLLVELFLFFKFLGSLSCGKVKFLFRILSVCLIDIDLLFGSPSFLLSFNFLKILLENVLGHWVGLDFSLKSLWRGNYFRLRFCDVERFLNRGFFLWRLVYEGSRELGHGSSGHTCLLEIIPICSFKITCLCDLPCGSLFHDSHDFSHTGEVLLNASYDFVIDIDEIVNFHPGFPHVLLQRLYVKSKLEIHVHLDGILTENQFLEIVCGQFIKTEEDQVPKYLVQDAIVTVSLRGELPKKDPIEALSEVIA
jgi:hypothetical protein